MNITTETKNYLKELCYVRFGVIPKHIEPFTIARAHGSGNPDGIGNLQIGKAVNVFYFGDVNITCTDYTDTGNFAYNIYLSNVAGTVLTTYIYALKADPKLPLLFKDIPFTALTIQGGNLAIAGNYALINFVGYKISF